ncbi:hypothetical protein [Streptomyces sp. NPDC048272]|uniref:hypothetical protein n=1 Tax=Streptomyces sp. NPDC048272 TaxID=3154616 RepID=UPI00342F7ECB
MARIWTNNKRGIKDFEKALHKGMEVWTINEHAMITAQFEQHTASSHRCTGKHVITGEWMFGTTSATSLLCGSVGGQVFEQQPRGFRDLASPEPDCRDEGYGLPRGYGDQTRRLDRDEIRHMDKRAREAAEQYTEDRKAGRRGRWF